MIDELKQKNSQFKELNKKLKQTPQRTILELEETLASVADRKAFILLLDSFETEKSITRDLLENLIDQSYEINDSVIYYLENEIDFSKGFSDIFSIKNIKSILIFAIGAGIVISIVMKDGVGQTLLNAFTQSMSSSSSSSPAPAQVPDQSQNQKGQP
jgi:hypothetical protein